jgi:hypothetical protein
VAVGRASATVVKEIEMTHPYKDILIAIVKPKTICIGTFEVPAPVREPLEVGQAFWIADTSWEEGVSKWFWDGGDTDNIWLKHGLIHLDEGAARLHAEALLSFTKRG